MGTVQCTYVLIFLTSARMISMGDGSSDQFVIKAVMQIEYDIMTLIVLTRLAQLQALSKHLLSNATSTDLMSHDLRT